MQEISQKAGITPELILIKNIPAFFRSDESDKASLSAPINIVKVARLLKESKLTKQERNYVLGIYSALKIDSPNLGSARERVADETKPVFENNTAKEDAKDRAILKAFLPTDTSFLEKRKIVDNF